LFGDELFADLFVSGRGRPSVPGDVIATVMVLQALELRSRLLAFAERSQTSSALEFAAAYETFLTEVQECV